MKNLLTVSLLLAGAIHLGDLNSLVQAECTSFCFRARGGSYFAANYDFPSDMQDGLIFVNPRGMKKQTWSLNSKNGWKPSNTAKTGRWTSKHGSLTFNLAAYQLVWAGVNERGLTVSTMYLAETSTPKTNGRPMLDGSLWLQFLLDTCADVDEVVEKGNRFAVDTRDHYLIGDREGNCAVIEFLDGKMHVQHGENLPVKALTNSTYASSIKAFYSKTLTTPDEFRSLERYCIVARRLQKRDSTVTPIEFAFDTLHEARQVGETQWSIVFDIGKNRCHFKTRAHPQERYVDWSKLDFSLGAPTKMAEVQTRCEGDFTDQLGDYSHEVSLQHTFAFCKAYFAFKGIKGPADLQDFVERAVNHFEQFSSAPSR